MYDEIMHNLKEQLSLEEFIKIKAKNIHLGVFTEPYLTYILNGKKTIESRFSKNKIAPYNQINKGDIVIIKQSCGDILGYFSAKEVLFLDLIITPIEDIKKKYNQALYVDETFWDSKKDSNYATLIVIDKIVKLKLFYVMKKSMQTWIKFDKHNNLN